MNMQRWVNALRYREKYRKEIINSTNAILITQVEV